MSKIIKMSLQAMLSKIDLMLRENDIAYFCNNEEVIREFIEKHTGRKNKMSEVKQFLIDHEEYIDKERLVLLIVKNYKDNIEMIKERIEALEEGDSENNSLHEFTELQTLKIQYNAQTKMLEKVLSLGRGIESFLTFYYYDDVQQRYRVEVVDSRELIDGKKVSNSKNLNRFNEIDLYFKDGNQNEKLGMEYIIQALLLTDLYYIFPNEQFGNDIRTMILENEILRAGTKTKEELQALKTFDTQEEYAEVIDNVSFNELLPDVKPTLKEYAQYIDIDKLLLISAYRFNEGLENGYIDSRVIMSAKEILQGILYNIKSTNAQVCCQLQSKKDNKYELEEVSYSTKDIKRCISQFTNKSYLTTKEISEYREKINNQEITLAQIEPDEIDVVFSKHELEELSMLSEENLLYVSNKYEWNAEKIIDTIKNIGICSKDLLRKLLDNQKIGSAQVIELYEQSLVSLDDLRIIKEIVDLSKDINFEKLDSYYRESKEHPENVELLNKYNKYSNLYRIILLIGKSEEEIQEASNMAIEKIVEEFDGKDYNEAVKNYYRDGIITLDSIADWSNENLITSLFDEGLIYLEDIEGLVKKQKLSFDYLSNIYSNLAKSNDIEYDERLRLIKRGFIKEEDIIGLYTENLIFENDLRELSKKGFVREEKMTKAINSRTMEKLEKNSSIRLTGLNTLTKRNNNIYSNGYKDEISNIKDKTSQLIIDPNERTAFIHLLKAYRADTDLEEDSPFYNYEFYVIPDESGSIGLNSVVIAERYYEDKETEEKFATNNATYFFKYKDLMVLSNLRKSEMTKERDNVVFTAKHILADENKNGYWAAGVIYGIAKTMLSSDLKEYSKENQRKIILDKLNEMYSEEQVLEILEMASKIDKGEYTYEVVNPEDKILRKKVTKKAGPDITDYESR